MTVTTTKNKAETISSFAIGSAVDFAQHRAITNEKAEGIYEFAHQAERLGHLYPTQENGHTGPTHAVEAKFVTPQDPVILTANGGRLPAVPIDEAVKLNRYREKVQGREPSKLSYTTSNARDGNIHGGTASKDRLSTGSQRPDAPLRKALPPAGTNPLFPPLPLYGPPTIFRATQSYFFRASSAVLSLAFLIVIVLGAMFTATRSFSKHVSMRLIGMNPDKWRPFYEEEQRRQLARKEAAKAWRRKRKRSKSRSEADNHEEDAGRSQYEFTPTEGGPDPLVSDLSYYARRVGLDAEEFRVQTEDGFILSLWHVYNPFEYRRRTIEAREPMTPSILPSEFIPNGEAHGTQGSHYREGRRRYPVLLMHGLLQSAGAFCCNDDDSLAFYLCKAGYDVWLGNNRCGFKPEHTMLKYRDPRMWAWNIRQMGVMDLPALLSRVLTETGFPKLGLICHSQGTTQTFVALAKEQRPDIGSKISVFCALAPAAYAGPLIGKMYFKFMRAISPMMFRMIFGIHAFIPFMMAMHTSLPRSLYGFVGYRVFSFLFAWTDDRWDRGLRDRMFQFSPTYVSSESMRWWLGRECFAKQKCILATREEGKMEDEEDKEDEEYWREAKQGRGMKRWDKDRGRFAWYDKRAPPIALWVAGSDDLVDGRQLIRRFEHGREPHVRLVHKKIIEGYEHLDVIWAIDAIDKVGNEVKEVVWKTADDESKRMCRVPVGCGNLELHPAQHEQMNEETGGERPQHCRRKGAARERTDK